MKQIIVGQIMLWINILSVVIGYYLMENFNTNEYVKVVVGGIGVIGSGANLIFSIATQVDGYQKLKILPHNL